MDHVQAKQQPEQVKGERRASQKPTADQCLDALCSTYPDFTASLDLDDGFELVEVGLDVLLVEVATNVIHDVLENVIR